MLPKCIPSRGGGELIPKGKQSTEHTQKRKGGKQNEKNRKQNKYQILQGTQVCSDF